MTTPCVNWPRDWENTAEGGMVVYFCVLELHDPFVQCFTESTITMSKPDAETSGHSLRVWPPFAWPDLDQDTSSYALLAAVCVDSTTSSYWNGERHFAAGPEDLTPHGRALYDNLQALYGREVLIITLLDT